MLLFRVSGIHLSEKIEIGAMSTKYSDSWDGRIAERLGNLISIVSMRVPHYIYIQDMRG